MPKPFDPCKKFACMIQDCLDKNHFQEDRCHDALEQMRRCCLIHHKISLCCSGIALDKSYPLHKLPAIDDASTAFRTAK